MPNSIQTAARMRRYRARKRGGQVCVTLELTRGLIESLERAGWLPEDSSSDSAAVRAAFVLFVRTAAGRHLGSHGGISGRP